MFGIIGCSNPDSPDPVKETVATPVFSVASGAVDSGTSVKITCATEGAKFYYTTDGSEPTSSSTEYKNAISETAAVTIKAIAVKDGKMLPKELDLCIAEMHGVQQVHQITTQTLLQKIWRNKQSY